MQQLLVIRPVRLWLTTCLLAAAGNTFASAAPDDPPASGAAAAPATGVDVRAAAEWPLEKITLTDGKSYTGLIDIENAGGVEFVEVRRPPGKPMFLIVHTIDRRRVARFDRLAEADKQQLRERLAAHKRRAVIEAGRMEDLPLVAATGAESGWTYEGSWFTLASTAGEARTRREIVRLEQIFAAFRQVLPPRATPPKALQVRIFGERGQYRRALAEARLAIDNPAVYLPEAQLILAGSDMNRFDAQWAEINREHQEIRQQLDQGAGELSRRMKQLTDELKTTDIPPADRQKIVAAEQKKWEEQRNATRKSLVAIEKANAAKYEQVSAQMLARLAHEGFHAYLESFAFPHTQYEVPRWLNEGLAQIFETGRLEADSLRIDAPDPAALAKLKEDLRGQPLPLAELLRSGSDEFLSFHAQANETAARRYLYAWGLAYFLAFEESVIGTPRLNAYINPASAAQGAVERFEALVDMPLSQFEPRSRAAMLKLRGGS